MEQAELSEMTVAEIMRRWPMTLAVFIDLRMHCIGCPISTFHTPKDAAKEHDLPLDLLLAELRDAIAGSRVRGGRLGALRRSGTAGAARGSAVSGDRPGPDRPAPRR